MTWTSLCWLTNKDISWKTLKIVILWKSIIRKKSLWLEKMQATVQSKLTYCDSLQIEVHCCVYSILGRTTGSGHDAFGFARTLWCCHTHHADSIDYDKCQNFWPLICSEARHLLPKELDHTLYFLCEGMDWSMCSNFGNS